MKIFKRFLLLLGVVLIVLIITNYPKLNIVSGYSAKSTVSSVFLAGRTLELTDSTDNNFDEIKYASDRVDLNKKSATASTFGLLERKGVYREGLGGVLITKGFEGKLTNLKPKRSVPNDSIVFPYGNAEPKDSVFKNIDYERLNKSIEDHFNPVNKTRAVLVVYKNHIVAERYAEGFHKDSRILGWSMTKSVLSTVYGVLQYQDRINVNDKAPIEAWKNDERKEVTIHNLLQMNSGLEWDEDYGGISDVTKMLFLEEDMTKVQVRKELVGKPNETWNYSSGTSNLLSGILRQKLGSHQEYLDFWYREFIDKIGMNSMVVEADMEGNYVGSSYAWATPRDWAKFGLLYLHKGNWNGEQIFSENWVNYVTTPTPTSNGDYGAHFWLNAGGKMKDVPRNVFSANGFQGQRVLISPDHDLVVVRHGLYEDYDQNQFFKEIIKSINN